MVWMHTARTLLNVQEYIRKNPIPLEGSWDSVSGEEFLRKLLMEGEIDKTSYRGGVKDPLFSCVGTIGIDPRALGQRIMDIRTALAQEFVQVRSEAGVLVVELTALLHSALHGLYPVNSSLFASLTDPPQVHGLTDLARVVECCSEMSSICENTASVLASTHTTTKEIPPTFVFVPTFSFAGERTQKCLLRFWMPKGHTCADSWLGRAVPLFPICALRNA
jgi:hypothetical protein